MADRNGGYFGTMSRPWDGLSPEVLQAAGIIPSTIPTITRRQLEAQAGPQVQRIYENWNTLKVIVERHEEKIQTRWIKKSKLKRREILLSAWPGMAADHRPDHVAYQKRNANSGQSGVQYPVISGPQHDIFMMPYINQQDLCRIEPLLLMINSRGRNPPGIFAHADLAPSKFGHATGCIQVPPLLDGHIMHFPVKDVSTGYGELAIHDWRRVPRLPNFSPQQTPGIGLWLLNIQDRLYKFLVDVAQAIMHDIPAGELADPMYPVLPEPASVAANCRARAADGIVTLSNRNLEAPYVLPAVLDLERMKSLALARSKEAEDVLSALREDPSYFSSSLQEEFGHKAQLFVSQDGGTVVPLTLSSDTSGLLADTADKFVRSRFTDIETWSLLSGYMERLSDMKTRHGNTADYMPGELAIPMKQAYKHLEGMLQDILEPLPGQVVFSPAMRPYIRLPVGQQPGTARSVPTCPNKPADLQRLGKIFSEFNYDWKKGAIGPLDRIELLLDELDHFYKDGSARKTISSFIAAKISDLSLIAEFLRQLELLLPSSLGSLQSHVTFNVDDLKKASETDMEARTILANLEKSLSKPTSKMVIASLLSVSYPVDKRRTRDNVETMQKAELALDMVWKAINPELRRREAISARCQEILEREPYRTPDWRESSPELPKQPDGPDLNARLQSFRIDDQASVFVPPVRREKAKTRGNAAVGETESSFKSATELESPASNRSSGIEVDAKSLKVFRTMFFVPSTTSQPGEVAWDNYLHAMQKVGFALEKLGGSAWHFMPAKPPSTEYKKRSVCFHEPHPQSKLSFQMARRVGRRLQRAYGWDAETFTMY